MSTVTPDGVNPEHLRQVETRRIHETLRALEPHVHAGNLKAAHVTLRLLNGLTRLHGIT